MYKLRKVWYNIIKKERRDTMKKYVVNTDELREQMEFYSAYDHEGVAGYMFCEEDDKNAFIFLSQPQLV